MAKLDAPLRGLVSGDTTLSHLLTVHESPGRPTRYAVIMRVVDFDELKASHLAVASVAGQVATARLTREEILKAASLAGVVAIETPERRGLHHDGG